MLEAVVDSRIEARLSDSFMKYNGANRFGTLEHQDVYVFVYVCVCVSVHREHSSVWGDYVSSYLRQCPGVVIKCR